MPPGLFGSSIHWCSERRRIESNESCARDGVSSEAFSLAALALQTSRQFAPRSSTVRTELKEKRNACYLPLGHEALNTLRMLSSEGRVQTCRQTEKSHDVGAQNLSEDHRAKTCTLGFCKFQQPPHSRFSQVILVVN
jgi:hypothetical protein